MNTKKMGRPRRVEGEALEQLTIRLSSKLKFGLDLLARVQHRSLSQATEWALQNSLANVMVGANQHSLWFVLSVAWEEDISWRRWYRLFRFDPLLVPFDERHACYLVDRSPEEQFVRLPNGSAELRKKWDEVIEDHWPLLMQDAKEMQYNAAGSKPLLAEICALEDDYDPMMSIEKTITTAHAELLQRRMSEGFANIGDGIQVIATKLRELSETSSATSTAKPAGKRKPRGATKP